MKKRVLALLFGGALAVSLCACGGQPAENDSTDTSADTTQATEQQAEETQQAENKASVSDNQIDVTIKGASLGKNYEGKSTIVIDLNWTNHSGDSQMASVALLGHAYQDGVEIEQTMTMADGSGFDLDAADKNIKDGTSQDVQLAYVLANESADVEYEVGEWLGDSGQAEMTFSIAGGEVTAK